MTSLSAPSCRALLALVLGVCGTLAWVGTTAPASAAAVCRTGPSCVLVQVYDGGSRTDEVEVSLADVAAWTDETNGAAYTQRDSPGGPERDADVPPAVVSLRGLVDRLGAADGPLPGLAAESIRSATIPRVAGGSSVELDPFDRAYARGLLPVVYQVNAEYVAFLRPLLDDPADTNGRDLVRSDAGQPIVIRLNKSGRTLTPTITPASADIEPGDSVGFDVSVAEQTAATLSYRWTFGVGEPSTQRDPVHSYPRGTPAGTYRAQVVVSGDDGSVGQASVVVTVTPPGRLGPVLSIDDPGEARGTGDAFRLRVAYANPGTPDSYRWLADGTVISTASEPPRHAFDDEGRHTFRLEIQANGRTERSPLLEVYVDADPPPGGPGGPTLPPTTETPDPDPETNGNGDPDGPVTGPEDGDGTQTGTLPPDDAPTDPAEPGDPGEPTPIGGLTGILLTGAATPADAVPLPESDSATEQQAADVAAARPSVEAGGATRTIRWGLVIVPLLLLLGVAREAGWVSRLRSTWARRT